MSVLKVSSETSLLRISIGRMDLVSKGIDQFDSIPYGNLISR